MAPTNHDHSHDHDAFHAQHGHAGHDGLYNEDVAHEHSDVNVRALLMFCVGLAVLTGLVMVAMWGLFKVFSHQAAANDPVVSPLAVPAGQDPREPRLLTDEPGNLQKIRAEESKLLHEYGWIDPPTGLVSIPIDEAKKRLLEQGLPVRPDAPADPALGTTLPARGEASGGRVITAAPPASSTPGEGATPPPAAEHKPAAGSGGH